MNQSYQADTDKLLTELNNGLLTISFNRPEAMNALHPEMLTGVGALVKELDTEYIDILDTAERLAEFR
jgi:enoyl-CoA hydratase/carnithine racemase